MLPHVTVSLFLPPSLLPTRLFALQLLLHSSFSLYIQVIPVLRHGFSGRLAAFSASSLLGTVLPAPAPSTCRFFFDCLPAATRPFDPRFDPITDPWLDRPSDFFRHELRGFCLWPGLFLSDLGIYPGSLGSTLRPFLLILAVSIF